MKECSMAIADWMKRAVSPEAVMADVKPGAYVFLHGGCAPAFALETALAGRLGELPDVTVYQMHKEGPEAILNVPWAAGVRVCALFCGAAVRQSVAEGRAEYVPVFLSDIPLYIREGIFPVDVAVIQVSYPDAHGYCSLGTSVDVARQAVDSAKVVLAEVNRQMPRTHGMGMVHIDAIDAFSLSDRPLWQHEPKAPDGVAEAIAWHVAELVQDGATLQMGIGAIPDAVLAALGSKRDLGVHTEMFADGLIDLVEKGVITNARKGGPFAHRSVTSFVIGTQRVYDFVNDNPSVHFYPSDVVNDTALIRRHHRMTAINCALEVDLTGQIAADSIGTRIYSGIGGQMDFIRGAALAPEGRAIIALPATAKGGSISRITPVLTPGSGVVTTRGHVQYVVTEFGVADLRGKSVRERQMALIGIAHPDHRDALRAHAVCRHTFPSAALPGS
jgi:acyl-CoA hydrolase